MDFVDDGIRMRKIEGSVAGPIKGIVDDHALGHAPGVVAVVALEIGVGLAALHIGEHFRTPIDEAGNRFGVWIEKKFGGIEAIPFGGFVRAMYPVPIELSGLHAGQKTVPDVVGLLEHPNAQGFRGRGGIIEQTKIHAGGVFGEEREIDAFLGDGGAERMGAAPPDLEPGHDNIPSKLIRICRGFGGP